MRMVVEPQVERAVALSRHSPLQLPLRTDHRELHGMVYTHVLTMHSVCGADMSNYITGTCVGSDHHKVLSTHINMYR